MHQLDTKAAAIGRWRGILTYFGISDMQLSGRHTSCPLCGGKDRFRFDDKDGTGTYFCNNCGAGDGFKLLMQLKGWTFGEALKEIAPLVGQVALSSKESRQTPEQVAAYLKSIMAKATREIINPYLINRGITVKPDLYYHPALAHYGKDGKRMLYQAMLGILKAPDGQSICIHRTYLNKDGTKTEDAKKLTTPIKPISGGAIRLFPHEECLGIAEGIETACAAFQLFGVPTWAAYSANNLEKFIVPDGVKKVIVFADNDESFTGQNAAFCLARRLKASGIDCDVRVPEKTGSDWADYL